MEATKPNSPAAYLPQLDGLRALAFFGVAVSHWTPNFLAGIVPWGTGVNLFFVLSGFLITGILLRNRPADMGISLSAVLKVFYARRFLRIFPLYYGVLVLALLFGAGPIYSTWPWHFSYLSNVYYARHGHADAVSDPFLHLWSLSVEEQFYILWPLIALVARRRVLAVVLGSAIVGAMLFRVCVAHFAPGIVSIRYLTPSCLDSFAIGGLIAHAQCFGDRQAVRRVINGAAAVGFLGLVICTVGLPRVISAEDSHVIGHTFLVLIYGALVGQAALGFGGLPGRLLSLKPMLYLGKISYGLYVYHYLAPLAISAIVRRCGGAWILEQTATTLAAYTLFTLGAAALSWQVYELPLLRLKRYFAYPRVGALDRSPDRFTSSSAASR